MLYKSIRKHPLLYLMLVPALVYYILFHYLPMGGVIIAFKDFRPSLGIWGSPWAGLRYFELVFNDSTFWNVFTNTVVISIYRLIFGFPVPIILALLLNEFVSKRLKRTVQTIIYLPRFISWVIVGGLLFNLFAIDGGVVNQIITGLGHDPVNFLSNPNTFRSMIIVSDIVKIAGWNSIIFTAAITSINPELYEQATIDGASRLAQVRYVTLPCLMPTISIMLILTIGIIMNVGFEQIITLYNPAVYSVGDIIDTFVYRRGLEEGRFSYAAAVGLFRSIIACFLIFFANLVAKRMGQEGLF